MNHCETCQNYKPTKEETWIDEETGLEWSNTSKDQMAWQDALKYAEKLRTNDSDWRLPTISELITLIDFTKANPASKTHMISSYYWSSTTHASRTSYAWSVRFNSGYVSYDNKSYSFYVRCVRGGQ